MLLISSSKIWRTFHLRALSTLKKRELNHYEVLGVDVNASPGDIKMAYYEKTKLCHPDVVTPSPENLALFRRVSDAYAVLGNSTSRKNYDENVLGIIGVGNKLDDIFAAHQNKILRYDIQQSWTKQHYGNLRMAQFKDKSDVPLDQENKQYEASRIAFGFGFLILCIVYMECEGYSLL